jgi:hypothetical protein
MTSAMKPITNTMRLDRLIGRKILTANNRSLGRLEECRAERRDDSWVVTEWVIGSAGLLERLGFGVRMILGMRAGRSFVARWDQLDLSDPDRPRLKCSLEELRPA